MNDKEKAKRAARDRKIRAEGFKAGYRAGHRAGFETGQSQLRESFRSLMDLERDGAASRAYDSCR